ncbi:hypothetical protein AA0113_g12250 [Alternaria arborescens]|uniref:Cyanovirin-N domain-containing protein n=1 Tax=Alternaria arborescens TaxID=156630 RepID=A0A4Q4PXS6_9PLEO|nr:hypothetical protein AA0113_g12250 [Alternaria arborescens]
MRCSGLFYSAVLLGSIFQLASGTCNARLRRQTAEIALPLSDLCAGPELDGSSFTITCSIGPGFSIPSIDLNSCLNNDDGVLGFSHGSAFLTCSGCELQDLRLTCNCQTIEHGPVSTMIDLSKCSV